MSRIVETIIEPSKIYTGSIFKIKIKVEGNYAYKHSFITESGLNIITENNDIIRTEWGE